ncbi:MAG: CDP-diacylglycerol--glycerol-3-phosphate 3-phosphatidyltransferase, partial [Verrucomicrobiota bacterium]
MTTANKITIGRILLIPFFIVQALYYVRGGDELNRFCALFSFALAAVADGIDGYVARRYNQRSELGTILDPLADKLLLVSAVILLSLDTKGYFVRLPLWFTATLISRDVILSLGLLMIHYTFGKVKVRPRLLGKAATVFQMATVLWILLKWPERVLPFLIWGATIFTSVSGAIYIFDGIRRLNE